MKKNYTFWIMLLLFTIVKFSFAQTNLVPVSARIPELKLWVDAEEQTGADGSSVTTVNDQAGVVSGISVQGLVTLNITPDGKKEFSFAGLDNYINLGQPAALDFTPGTDEFTIMGLIGSDIPGDGTLISRGGTSGVQYHIEISNNKFWVRVGGNPSSNRFDLSNGLIDQNINFALAVSQNESKLYINGQLIETKGTEGIGTATYDEDILIGETTTWDWEYSDHIRSVGMFSKALSSSEIQAIYSDIINPPAEPETGTAGLWNQNGSNIHFNMGNVAIGTTDAGNDMLAVNGNIRAKEVKVESANWPDYVFTEKHKLLTIEEIQKYIQEKGHLPNIPSANEVRANGIKLGEMDRLLLEKIEELTLYIIKQEKKQIELENKLELLKSKLDKKSIEH
ncbi:hypothetical protein PP182_19855 [Maribacter sp. PR1]|uniref:LamG-like jellyroll fold domain-containing protein n=1 Tax=Maribacter cobaltidurans TaxID=1178778 RepID=A0ABU7IZS3_9FLAO|nr:MULTISPECIES: LamG-like jellyroll fold domain-containing protein [Maribacter]MDC6390951.1 hypothetical protein [Maribacter sp. PR1]MEE1978343.1 LamG-like jellyroll fold domain-containing protein [Maribacter cobaltidurans]